MGKRLKGEGHGEQLQRSIFDPYRLSRVATCWHEQYATLFPKIGKEGAKTENHLLNSKKPEHTI